MAISRSFTLIVFLVFVAVSAVACSSADMRKARDDANNLSDRVIEVTAALEKAQAQIKDVSQQAQEKSSLLQDCLANQTQLQNKSSTLIDSLGDDLAAAHADLEACEERAGKVDDYESIIADAARRICCAQRVERPEIDSFSLVKERIVCEQGGDTELDC